MFLPCFQEIPVLWFPFATQKHTGSLTVPQPYTDHNFIFFLAQKKKDYVLNCVKTTSIKGLSVAREICSFHLKLKALKSALKREIWDFVFHPYFPWWMQHQSDAASVPCWLKTENRAIADC